VLKETFGHRFEDGYLSLSVDVKEMRHIAHVKRTDLIGLSVAFVATLALGIELGILVAVVASPRAKESRPAPARR